MARSPDRFALLKGSLFVFALFPVMRLVWGAINAQLGANPLEFITRSTGDWTLYFLCLTLAITPLRQLFGWHSLARLRRMFGLYAFFYASLHALCFIWFDHFFAFDEALQDIFKRPFILVGMLAFIALLPLALTSTNRMIKRVGAKRWQALHRLVYVIALLALLHFYWMKAGKHDFAQPVLFGLILGSLLGWRIWRATRKAD